VIDQGFKDGQGAAILRNELIEIMMSAYVLQFQQNRTEQSRIINCPIFKNLMYLSSSFLCRSPGYLRNRIMDGQLEIDQPDRISG
jgi:hypothetical protein